jgi:CDP-glucose 4,6-dehydratase
VITSDKCYENNEWPHSYRENDRLGGHDIYSMSKAATELVTAGWRSSFFSNGKLGKLITLRAGNVIGGGDFSKDRLIPDCVRSAAAGTPIVIRSPKSTRPWQHVLDCLHGYLLAASKVDTFPAGDAHYEAFNFGPAEGGARPVLEVVQTFFEGWSNAPTIVIDEAKGGYHEAGYLSVAIEKAGRLLGWHPVWPFSRALAQTSAWYQAWQTDNSVDLAELAGQQIVAFEADAAQS